MVLKCLIFNVGGIFFYGSSMIMDLKWLVFNAKGVLLFLNGPVMFISSNLNKWGCLWLLLFFGGVYEYNCDLLVCMLFEDI